MLLAVPAAITTHDNTNELPKFLLSSPGDSLTSGQSLIKRTTSFSSCTGVYDRELLARLDRVCEDCYNLYRDVEVAVGCRCVLLCVDIQVIMCSEGMRCVIIDVYNAHVLICN